MRQVCVYFAVWLSEFHLFKLGVNSSLICGVFHCIALTQVLVVRLKTWCIAAGLHCGPSVYNVLLFVPEKLVFSLQHLILFYIFHHFMQLQTHVCLFLYVSYIYE